MVKRTELAEKNKKYPLLLRQPRLLRNRAFITYLINKQGIFRTIEAFIAIFITFVFLTVFIPQQREQAIPQTPPNVLATLRSNDDFRNCVMLQNYTCVNQSVDNNLEDKYYFKTNISQNPYASAPSLPQKRIYANSMFVAGNTTNSTSLIVRLYFWAKE